MHLGHAGSEPQAERAGGAAHLRARDVSLPLAGSATTDGAATGRLRGARVSAALAGQRAR
eukprot:443564-Prymnesium_polylepis.3